MERYSILMLSSMALYLLSMVEVSSLAFVPGTHRGTGNIQLRGARAGASHAGVTGGASEPLVGQSVYCLRVVAAMLSVSAASLSMRGSHATGPRSQSCVAVKAAVSDAAPRKEKKAATAKKAAAEEPKKEVAKEPKKKEATQEPKKEAKKEPEPEPKKEAKKEPEAKKEAPPPPAPKKTEAKKPEEDTRSLKEKMAGRAPYEEKIDGMVPLEKLNAKFRNMAYESIQHWQIDPKAIGALKEGPIKDQVIARYKAINMARFGKVNIAGAWVKKHPPSFFANMVMEAAKAQDDKVAVAKDLFELGKKLTSGLEEEIKKKYEGAAGDDELVSALMSPIGSSNKVVKTLITFLLSKGRLAQLKDICFEFSILSYMDAQIVPVIVQSQTKLSSGQKKKIEDALAEGLDTKTDCLKVEYEVSEAILAGVKIMFDFDDPINRLEPRREYDFDFRNIVRKSLSREFGV